MFRLCLCIFLVFNYLSPRVGAEKANVDGADTMVRAIVNVESDFNKLKTDPELTKYVQPVLDRLKTFKLAVHPRIRLFYELLKVGMQEHARHTADSLYIPDKYNVVINKQTTD